MAGYGPQFTAMLLSKQGKQADIDQKAAAENALIKQEQQKQLMSAMQTAGTGIASALKTVKNDSTANSMMDKQDAANQQAAYDATVGEDGYSDGSVAEPDPSQLAHHTGGVDEMTLQLQMDKQKQSQMQSQLLASRASYYDQMPQVKLAQQTANALTQDQKQKMIAADHYNTTLPIYTKALQNAKSQSDYDIAASRINGLYDGAQALGIKSIQKPMIPPYQPGAPSSINPTGSEGLPGYPGTKAPWYNPWGGTPAVPAHQAPSSISSESPAISPSSGGGGIHEGATATNPSTGQTMIYTNGAWVSQ